MSALALTLLPILVAAPPALEDYQSLPGYLEAPAVQPVVEAALPPMAACFPGAEAGAGVLSFDVDSRGQVSHSQAVLEPADELHRACVLSWLCALDLPSHDEPSSRWEFRIAFRDGQVFLLPSLRHVPRPRLPILLKLPDEGGHEGLGQLLGPAWPTTPLEPLPACPAPAASQPPRPATDPGTQQQRDL
jgi:hypothetical protein